MGSKGSINLCSYLYTNFLTDVIKSRLAAANTMKKDTKITTLSEVGSEVPLNEENLTMAESRTKIIESTMMKIIDFLLVRSKVTNGAILSIAL